MAFKKGTISQSFWESGVWELIGWVREVHSGKFRGWGRAYVV